MSSIKLQYKIESLYVRDDLRIVDITVGDSFLVLCNQNFI